MIAVPLSRVWEAAADLGAHSEWMADAEAIEFLSATRRGVGTRMAVATRLGPLRTTDVIEVTEWVEGERIAVRHRGLVTGAGAFELTPLGEASTRLQWRERLAFPWFLGGPLTAWAAAPILGAVWRANLKRLKGRLEA